MNEILAQIEECYESFITEAKKTGVLAAQTRARKSSMKMRELMKEFKKASIAAGKPKYQLSPNKEILLEK